MRHESAPPGTQLPIFGRQQELHELQRLFFSLRDGLGGLVTIGGEVGVGKTALVSTFISQINLDHASVFIGHCFDLETTAPYGPWLNSGILDLPPVHEQQDATPQDVAAGNTPERQQILEFLIQHGPARPTDVATSLGISPNAAAQSLRRLLASKHVTRPAYGLYAAVSVVSPELFDTNQDSPGNTDPPVVSRFLSGQQTTGENGTRRSLYLQIWDRLSALAQARPVVLVLEDMHWADQASVELLRFVARKVFNVPILIVVTYRDVELATDQPLYLYLPYVVKEGNATRIALRRLNEASIQDLLAQRYNLPPADELRLVRHIRQYTDGNAFFVHEVLLTMEQNLQLEYRDGLWRLVDLSTVHIPPLVQQVIDGRLAHLNQRDRQLLQIAAVIGNEVPLDLLREVSGEPDEQIIETIENAIDTHLLESMPGRPFVRFRHSLVREALSGSILSLRYQSLHRRVADTLLGRRVVDPDAVANHLRLAHDERAGEWLIRAGERAGQQFAWIDAVERFQLALNLLPNTPETALYRGWLHFHIGMLARRSDALSSAESLQTAREIAESAGIDLLYGLATSALGLIQCISGEIRAGLSVIEQGVNVLESLDMASVEPELRSLWHNDPLFVRLPVPHPASQRGVLIHWLAVTGYYTEAIEMGERFTRDIPELPPPSEVFTNDDFFDAYLGLGHAFNMRARPVEAAAAIDRAYTGYSNAANLPLSFLQIQLMHLLYFKLDNASERNRVERLVTDVWESHRGMLQVEIAERFRPPRLLFWYGEWDEVDRISRNWASGSVNTSTKLVGLGLGMLARHRGQVDEAWHWTRNALNARPDDAFGNCWCELAMQAQRLAAELSLDAGNLSESRWWIDVHEDHLRQSGAILGRAQHHALEARYHDLQGSIDLAIQHAEHAVQYATDPHQALDELMAHRTLGELMTRTAAFAEAEVHLATAYELATNCAARFEIALTCRAQAALMIQNGKLAGARHKLAEARSIAIELGAEPLLRRLSELSDLLSDSGRKRARPGGLSPRELEVLQLVARGMTDAEIAEHLFVSPRTVSGHLHSIYTKLSVSSRSAATAFAFTHNLV